MSLEQFQRALADLIASPRLCLTARAEPDSVFNQYDLSARERQRLLNIAGQKGMSTSCSLYRHNRVTPIYTLLHFSCLLLGEDLEAELDAYWASTEFTDFQFRLEIARFAQFLRRRLHQGALRDRRLADVLSFELAANELQYLPRRAIRETLMHAGAAAKQDRPRLSPLVRVVKSSCDLMRLIEALSQGSGGRCVVATGEYFYLLSALGEAHEVAELGARIGRILYELQHGSEFTGT